MKDEATDAFLLPRAPGALPYYLRPSTPEELAREEKLRRVFRAEPDTADMKLTIAGQAQGLEILQEENTQLRAALQRFVTAAKSWHDFHHGSETIQCDRLCECIAPGERALAGVPEAPQAPIARLAVDESGKVTAASLYAPGLPPGEHDLYCEPEAVAPYLRKETE